MQKNQSLQGNRTFVRYTNRSDGFYRYNFIMELDHVYGLRVLDQEQFRSTESYQEGQLRKMYAKIQMKNARNGVTILALTNEFLQSNYTGSLL